ncbi:MAG: hypothetical protein HOQ09_08345 [Gemmatimonadaceae bacterium]|nr:hypothetical protein [Gemmatimonadaceae bacterium]
MDTLLKRRILSGTDHWLITEVDARGVPGARADRCLICQSEQVVRRLWVYPTKWHELSDEALVALCDGKLADRASPPSDRSVGARPSQRDSSYFLDACR